MEMIRIDKYLTDGLLITRKEAKNIIKSGRVKYKDVVVTDVGFKVEDSSTDVFVDDNAVFSKKFRYYLMNKPSGILTATEDKKQKTVLDLLPANIRHLDVAPVGRLDKDTTGLLIITNDGVFAHNVISPKSEIPKKYFAKVDGILTEDSVKRFETGIVTRDGAEFLPAKLEIITENSCYVTVVEGKYHQVKRMLAAVEAPVLELCRVSIGTLNLEDEDLEQGEYRELDESELCRVLN